MSFIDWLLGRKPPEDELLKAADAYRKRFPGKLETTGRKRDDGILATIESRYQQATRSFYEAVEGEFWRVTSEDYVTPRQSYGLLNYWLEYDADGQIGGRTSAVRCRPPHSRPEG